MIRNPYANAVFAALYIAGIVLFMSTITDGGTEESLLIPMAMLSLLVLSVSVMGMLFFLQPILLFLEGKKKEAVTFFVSTVVAFAFCAALFLCTALIA